MKTTFKYIFIIVTALTVSSVLAKAQTYSNGLGFYQYFNPANPTTSESFKTIIETFVTGTSVTVTTEERVPADIVLVLDSSGSMDDDLQVGNISTLDVLDTNIGATEGKYYFRYWGGLVKYQMRYSSGVWQYKKNLSISGRWVNIEDETTFKISDLDVYINKIDALKIAVNKFLDVVYADSETNLKPSGKYHQVSIIKFADDEYSSGAANLTEGNSTGVSEVVKNLTNIETGLSTLKSAVSAIDADGATAADYGMALAELEIETNGRNGTAKTVVMFTDGEPTYLLSFDSSVASSAISTAQTLKSDYKCTVFTVGVLDSPSTNTTNYMNYVSSNYPDATSMDSAGTRAATGDYYSNASSSLSLNDVFTTIAESATTGSASVSYSSTTTSVSQNFNDSFELPEGTSTSDIKVYTSQCTACPDASAMSTAQWSDFTFNDAGKTALSGATVTISDDEKKVSVKGFDFANWWVGQENGSVRSDAKKLIIEIPVEATANNTGGDMAIGDTEITDTDPDIPDYIADPVKFESVNIVFNVTGLNPGETIIYEVKNKSTNALVGNVIVTNENGTTSTTVTYTIKSLPVADYTATANGWNLRTGLSSYDTSTMTDVDGVYTIDIDLSSSSLTTVTSENVKVNTFYSD